MCRLSAENTGDGGEKEVEEGGERQDGTAAWRHRYSLSASSRSLHPDVGRVAVVLELRVVQLADGVLHVLPVERERGRMSVLGEKDGE